MGDDKLIDEQALDRISVAPGDPRADEAGSGGRPAAEHPDQRAGQDEHLQERLERDPSDPDAKLDVGLDQTMDASDPPSITRPGGDEPAPSSGYPG